MAVTCAFAKEERADERETEHCLQSTASKRSRLRDYKESYMNGKINKMEYNKKPFFSIFPPVPILHFEDLNLPIRPI